MVKYQFSKNWSWCAEVKSASLITDKIIEAVYRLDATPCSLGACKTNCLGNPYCLNGLGEKKLINLINKEPSMPMAREDYLRKLADYAGLVNLGATCYINTYLQVWYNNIQFREYILGVKFEKIQQVKDSDPDPDPECESEAMPVLKFESHECLGANLQMMFTLMKESVRRSIDPNFFIRAIGLDENMQQDAQEFSQLFLTTIQSSLSAYDLGQGGAERQSDIIQELFEGEYSYITECYHCKRQSVRHSNFVELSLNIQNCSTIRECLDDLLKEEIMDGENQYYCSNCDHKRNAKRMTKLARLPPVLNLQLLRFVYDRTSGYKKKLSSRIKFSESLDLSAYSQQKTPGAEPPQPVYQLGAILMHVGKTAYSGHYMAQIKNFKSNEWYNFNDEVITKIKRKQQLGCTDDEIDSAKQNTAAAAAEEAGSGKESGGDVAASSASAASGGKGANKTFSTANAYLLVYYRADLMHKMSGYDEKACASNQHDVVAEDNERLESWFNVLQTNKINQNDSKNTERAVVHSIFESLWSSAPKLLPDTRESKQQQQRLPRNVSSSRELASKAFSSRAGGQRSPMPVDSAVESLDKQKLYFVTTEFLKKLISQQSNIYPSDAASINSIQKFMCPHRRLNPLAINRFKVVSKLGIDQIMDCYNLRPADIGALEVYNEQSTLCRQCVVNCYEYLRFKEKLKQDSKLLRQLLKYSDVAGELNNEENGAKMAAAESESEPKQAARTTPPEEGEKDFILIDMDDENSGGSTAASSNTDSNNLEVLESSSNGPDNSHKESVSPGGRTLFSNINGVVEKSTKPASDCDSHSSNSSSGRKNPASSSNNENKENSNGASSAQRYYIGKESLKCWQSLALKRLEAQLPSFKFSEPPSGATNESLPNSQTDATKASTNGEPMSAEPPVDIPEIVLYEEPAATTTAKDATDKKTLPDTAGATTTVTVFNEDITCPHNCLAPTPNKRLVNSTLWNQIFQHYFYSGDSSKFKTCPIFTDEAKECKLCLKTNEEISNKKIEIKNQKDVLPDLYFNKLRPTLQNMQPFQPYYLVMSEFVREWRAMIKQFKFKSIKIINQVLFCDHFCLPFDQDSIDDSLVMLLTEPEWNYLSENYEFDMEVTITKVPKELPNDQLNDAGEVVKEAPSQGSPTPSVPQFDFVFKPQSCYLCLKQKELSKMQFENKKIFVRQIDEDNLTTTPVPSSVLVKASAAVESKDEDLDSNQTASKRARLSDDAERETGSSSLAKSSASSSNIRRSKRTRKCKGDMELHASSSDTVKSLKIQMAAKVSRMISEQHLFFNNVELDNDKTLGEYSVLAGDILYLKIDQITSEEIDSSPFEFAHLPEIGFKGTNLLK